MASTTTVPGTVNMSNITTVPVAVSVPAPVVSPAQAQADRGKQVLGEIVTSALVEQTKLLNKMLLESINDVRKADSTLYPKIVAIEERQMRQETALNDITPLLVDMKTKLDLLVERSEKKYSAGIWMNEPGPSKNMFDRTERVDLDHD